MTDQQSTTFLFGVELDWQKDLKEGPLSVRFRQKFEENEISLSRNVNVIEPKEKSDPWRIRDEDEHHTYLVVGAEKTLEIHSPTDVILVVKGAGLHEPGDTLNQFIQGFWPAMIELASEKDGENAIQSTIRQEHELLKDHYEPPPHIKKEHAHLAEISIRDPSKSGRKEAISHRILVKEAYWELGENPPSSWKALFNEWHMATYALRRELTNWLRSLVLRFLRVVSPKILTRIANLLKVIPPRLTQLIRTRGEPARDLIRDVIRALIARTEFPFFFLSFWVIYSFLGTVLLVSLQKGNFATLIGLEDAEDILHFLRDFPRALFYPEPLQLLGLSFLFAASMAFFMSWRPALQIRNRRRYQEERLPGLQRWILIPLIITFVFNTWDYLIFFVLLLVPVVLTNISRSLWWSHRKEANTDRQYETFGNYMKKSGRKVEKGCDFLMLKNLFPLMVLYRMMVVWALPVAFLGLGLAKVLIATKVLGAYGKTLEEFLNNRLGGSLGDVSAYAMDPSLALRIRSAVEYDIKFFHQMKEVSNIHIFAHSQGTPITFETLFTHMPKEYRKKIKTYVTIGSVLSYYYQIVPVLDEVYFPERFRKSDYELGTFADGFRWFNCWNLADNITGFYGLDEYDLDRVKQSKTASGEVKYPTNIKTRFRGHSDYWTNLEEVQLPFARRVLHDEVDKKWIPKTRGIKFLFGVGLEYQDDLEVGPHTQALSRGLQQEFESHGITLSDNVTFTRVVESTEWRVKDNDTSQTYIVRKQDGVLNIYGSKGFLGVYLTALVLTIPAYLLISSLLYLTRTWRRIGDYLPVAYSALTESLSEIESESLRTLISAVGDLIQGLTPAFVALYEYRTWILLVVLFIYTLVQIWKPIRFLCKMGLFTRGWIVRHRSFLRGFLGGRKKIKEVGLLYRVDEKYVQQMVAYVGANWWAHASPKKIRDDFGFSVEEKRLETMRNDPQAAVEFLEELSEEDAKGMAFFERMSRFYRKRLEYPKGGMNEAEVTSMAQNGGRDSKEVEDQLDSEGKDFLDWVNTVVKPRPYLDWESE